MSGEVIRSRWVAHGLDIGWAREKSANCAWIGSHAAQGVLRCQQFEENIHVFSGFLIPTRRVRLDINAQVRVTSKKLFQQRRQEVAGHGDRTNHSKKPAWTGAALLQQLAAVS